MVDPAVGFVFARNVGDAVKAGELLVTVHAPDDDARTADAVARLEAAITVGPTQPAEVPLLLERIG